MNDTLGLPTTGAFFFSNSNAVTGRPFGRGFGLIDDDIHALIEYAPQANPGADTDGLIRRVTTCG